MRTDGHIVWNWRRDRTDRFHHTASSTPTCDTIAGPDGVQSVDLGIYASCWTNLRAKS